MEGKKVNNITEYIQNICEINEQIKDYSPFKNAELLFRGQADIRYELLPYIGRNREFDCQCTIFNDERNMIELAKYKLPEIFHNGMSPLELLALLQHHKIPTRLLDVTENALVALYFACCSEFDKDAEVFVFKNDNDDVTNYPIVDAIADSYRFTRGTWTELSSFYGNIKKQPYFLEQIRTLEICHKNDECGGAWVEECCEKIIYVYAPIRSVRQRAQQGRYILFPNHICEMAGKKCFGHTIDAIPKDHKNIIGRIIIPKEIKKKLLEDLAVLGIKKDVLFADNLDVVCNGIVEQFARKYK